MSDYVPRPWWGAEAPWVYVEPPGTSVESITENSPEGALVVSLDGALLRTKAELMDSIASKFSFPGDWGRNWDAMSDCLQDLSWIKGRVAYLLMVDNANMFLGRIKADFDTFVEILEEVGAAWASDEPAVAFNSVIIGGPAPGPFAGDSA